MDEPNLLQETYGVNITAYYNDLSNNMNELARKAVNSMSEELKKLDIFDEQALEKVFKPFLSFESTLL